MKFTDKELQRSWDEYIEMQNSPKFKDNEAKLIRQERKDYWTSLPFLLILILSLRQAGAVGFMHWIGFSVSPLVWGLVAALSMVLCAVTFPRYQK